MLSSTAASVLASPSIRSIRRRDVLFASVTSSRTALSSLVSVYWLLGCSLSDPEEAPANRDTFGEDFDRLALSGPFPFPFRPMLAATGFSGVSESKSFRQPPQKCLLKFRAVATRNRRLGVIKSSRCALSESRHPRPSVITIDDLHKLG